MESLAGRWAAAKTYWRRWRPVLGGWVAIHAVVTILWLMALWWSGDWRISFQLRTFMSIRFDTLAIPAIAVLLGGGSRSAVGKSTLAADAIATMLLQLGGIAAHVSDRLASPRGVDSDDVSFLVVIAVLSTLLGFLLAFASGAMAVFLAAVRLRDGYLHFRGCRLRAALAPRGYGWLTTQQASQLWCLCGSRAYSLPPWEEVGALPDVSAGDMTSLACVALAVRKRR